MKTTVQTPAGVGAWQVVCEQCGARYAVLIGLADDELAEDHRPAHCCFCLHRVAATFAVQRPT